jgi:hypothetical protein
VRECSGSTRVETELPCRWEARDRPAGKYRLIALSDGEVRYDGAPADTDVHALVFHA